MVWSCDHGPVRDKGAILATAIMHLCGLKFLGLNWSNRRTLSLHYTKKKYSTIENQYLRVTKYHVRLIQRIIILSNSGVVYSEKMFDLH